MRKLLLINLLISFSYAVAAQDPEFAKGFIMHLRLHNGVVTNFHGGASDEYVGGISLIPQVTLIDHKLRGGIIADGFYGGKKFQAAFGPTVSLKLKSIKAGPLGSAANIHLNFDYLVGTEKERLIGGGINADVLNWIIIGLSAHRDYNLNTWWFQNSVAIRLSKIKKDNNIIR